MKRRNFLKGAASGSFIAALGPSLGLAKSLENFAKKNPGKMATICISPPLSYAGWVPELYLKKSVPGELLFIDLETHKTQRTKLLNSGHKAVQNPHNFQQFVVPSKWERTMSVVDFSKKNKVSLIETQSPKCTFFGHALFRADGNSYFCTEYDLDKDTSLIVERDSKKHQVIRSLPTYGHLAHDFFIEEEKNLAWVVNRGPFTEMTTPKTSGASRLPNVSLIDLHDGKLVQQIFFSEGAYPAHFFPMKDRSAILHGFQRVKDGHLAPMIATFDLINKPEVFTPDPTLSGEALSVALDKETLLVSVRDSDTVLRWDLKKHSIIERWNFRIATGVLNLPSEGIWMADTDMSRIFIQKEDYFQAIHEDLSGQLFGSHFSVVEPFDFRA